VSSPASLPDPDAVDSAETFNRFVVALAESLQEALRIEPTSKWQDSRGEWVNWTLSSFVVGMASWIKSAGRLPLDRDRHQIWAAIIPTHGIWDGSTEDLSEYLARVQGWASAVDRADAEPWREAAEAMYAGASYE
jgi:hypothetical protein